MKKKGMFVHMILVEFNDWFEANRFDRKIGVLQNHHTYIPAYAHFKDDNHFALCESMERSHIERGFAKIGQNLTIFPDADVVLCRSFNTISAGIKGGQQKRPVHREPG